MDKLEFSDVVVLGPYLEERRVLNSVPAALAFMLEVWPGDTGPLKEKAIQTLKRAIAGEASAEDARTAFVLAAREAGVLAVEH
jgi:hypothetical protein